MSKKDDEYREMIIEVINKISSNDLLKRIYALAEYLYIHKQ